MLAHRHRRSRCTSRASSASKRLSSWSLHRKTHPTCSSRARTAIAPFHPSPDIYSSSLIFLVHPSSSSSSRLGPSAFEALRLARISLSRSPSTTDLFARASRPRSCCTRSGCMSHHAAEPCEPHRGTSHHHHHHHPSRSLRSSRLAKASWPSPVPLSSTRAYVL
jgi:hypothetical protein